MRVIDIDVFQTVLNRYGNVLGHPNNKYCYDEYIDIYICIYEVYELYLLHVLYVLFPVGEAKLPARGLNVHGNTGFRIGFVDIDVIYLCLSPDGRSPGHSRPQ